MEFEFRSVPLERIDESDHSFRISFGRSAADLEASIRTVGLIHAPLLLPTGEDHYIVVSGFARLEAVRKLGWAQVGAMCLPRRAAMLETALTAVAENFGQRPLNIVEQARCAGLIARHGAAGPEEQARRLRELGFSINAAMVDQLNRILQMSEKLQQGLARGDVALPVALRLHELQDEAAAEELLKLFMELRLGLNRQREVLEWVQAIARRDDLAVGEILNRDPLALWRADRSIDRGHASQLIRQHLKALRYPELSASEAHFTSCLKALKLPPQLHLNAPPFFEGHTFSLRLEFRDILELLQLNGEVQRIAVAPALAEIVALADPAKRDRHP